MKSTLITTLLLISTTLAAPVNNSVSPGRGFPRAQLRNENGRWKCNGFPPPEGSDASASNILVKCAGSEGDQLYDFVPKQGNWTHGGQLFKAGVKGVPLTCLSRESSAANGDIVCLPGQMVS